MESCVCIILRNSADHVCRIESQHTVIQFLSPRTSRTHQPPSTPHHYEFPYAVPPLLRRLSILTGIITVKQFIRNVRAAKTIADERAVVQKESAAIRSSFREESHDSNVRYVD